MITFKLHRIGNMQNVILFLADKEKELVTLLSALLMIKEKDKFCVNLKNLLLGLVLMESNDIVGMCIATTIRLPKKMLFFSFSS